MIDFIAVQMFFFMVINFIGFTGVSEDTQYVINGVISLISVLYTGYFIFKVRRNA